MIKEVIEENQELKSALEIIIELSKRSNPYMERTEQLENKLSDIIQFADKTLKEIHKKEARSQFLPPFRMGSPCDTNNEKTKKS